MGAAITTLVSLGLIVDGMPAALDRRPLVVSPTEPLGMISRMITYKATAGVRPFGCPTSRDICASVAPGNWK